MHGKQSVLEKMDGFLFAGLRQQMQAGRYHSLVAATVPDCLDVTAHTEDGVVMAVQHRHLPVAAVQFHPESILSLDDNAGLKLIHNVLHVMCETYGHQQEAKDVVNAK
jgi:anthranilate synthase